MNNKLMPFMFGEQTVRTLIDENGNSWFVARDVCAILEIANNRDALFELDDDEKADVGITDVSSNGVEQRRSVKVISEPGLYALVFKSRKPEAKRFSKWVRSVVLPALRKNGYYEMTSRPVYFQASLPGMRGEEYPIERILADQHVLATAPEKRMSTMKISLRMAELDGGGKDTAYRYFTELCRIVVAPYVPKSEGQDY